MVLFESLQCGSAVDLYVTACLCTNESVFWGSCIDHKLVVNILCHFVTVYFRTVGACNSILFWLGIPISLSTGCWYTGYRKLPPFAFAFLLFLYYFSTAFAAGFAWQCATIRPSLLLLTGSWLTSSNFHIVSIPFCFPLSPNALAKNSNFIRHCELLAAFVGGQ